MLTFETTCFVVNTDAALINITLLGVGYSLSFARRQEAKGRQSLQVRLLHSRKSKAWHERSVMSQAKAT